MKFLNYDWNTEVRRKRKTNQTNIKNCLFVWICKSLFAHRHPDDQPLMGIHIFVQTGFEQQPHRED